MIKKIKMDNLEKEKWIEVKLGIMSYAHTTIDNRKVLKEYADELGWDLKEDKKGQLDEEGKKLYHMWIEPKGGKISPEEFGDNSQRIYGFAEILSRAISNNYDDEGRLMLNVEFGFLGDLSKIAKKEDVKMVLKYAGLLDIFYPLIKRKQLETLNKDLALSIFNNKTMQEEYEAMENIKPTLTQRMFNSDEYDRRKKMVDKLNRWFGLE